MDKNLIPGTGANESKLDPRTVKHEDIITAGAPLVTGGIVYQPQDHENQHNEGICTHISLVQNREKANGRKYSSDFGYLVQKKLYDGNWIEGSSILNALKVGKNIGFLPIELWTWTTEQDRLLPYTDYIAKLQAIPDTEVYRLIALCVDKIPGYASVDVTDPQSIARAINDSEAGILCMYRCGSTWWLPSWLPTAINPLRKPNPWTSGHAIGMTAFDYTIYLMQKLANTWGATWCLQGNADINWSDYPMQEAWSILRSAPVILPYKFNHDLWFGRRDVDNIELQRRLGVSPTDSNFGPKTLLAVIQYQRTNNISPAVGFVGPITRTSLNK
jgi:peptidoglycan hydrolase-like protein with peptidoglycan-binding domain